MRTPTVIYLICCKSFCKCHNVPPSTIKKQSICIWLFFILSGLFSSVWAHMWSWLLWLPDTCASMWLRSVANFQCLDACYVAHFQSHCNLPGLVHELYLSQLLSLTYDFTCKAYLLGIIYKLVSFSSILILPAFCYY
jgi:hypothetical protein